MNLTKKLSLKYSFVGLLDFLLSEILKTFFYFLTCVTKSLMESFKYVLIKID
jgi:hypothetical protein